MSAVLILHQDKIIFRVTSCDFVDRLLPAE